MNRPNKPGGQRKGPSDFKKKSFSKTDKSSRFKKKPFSKDDGESDYKKKPYSKPDRKSDFRKKPGFKPRSKEEELDAKPKTIRLNRFISISGICSRREADDLIKSGKIEVNGKVITEMGFQVRHKDKVKYEGKFLKAEKMQYVLLNKPKGFITTMKDERDRRTVMSLVSKACEERIYPVGRLDRQTTGLLLFTNDGELAKKLTHPSFRIRKIYHVELNKPITKRDFESIMEGLTLDDGEIKVDDLAILTEDNLSLGMEIHSGRNRIIRRIFEHLGYSVEKLDRVTFGKLTKKNLGRGKWRHLTDKEVALLS